MESQLDPKKEKNLIWAMVVFFINPFMALWFSIVNYLSTYSKNIVWFFCGFYGFTLYPVRTSMDSFRHREDFTRMAYQTNLSTNDIFSLLYSEDVKYVDVFLPVIKFFVSRFTDNPSYFYGVLGLFFGYFFSRNIWIIILYINRKLDKYELFFLSVFALIIAPWEINGFRFYMAAHVFLYSSLNYFLLKKKKFVLGLFVTPFIHFGFLFVSALFVTYKIVGNRLNFFYLLLLFSLFFNGIGSSEIQKLIPEMPIEIFNKKANDYTSEDYIAEREEGAEDMNWYATFKTKPLYFFSIFLAFLIFYKNREEIERSELFPYLCFTIFLMAVSFSLSGSVPVFFRYLRLSVLFFYGFLVLFFNRKKSLEWYKLFFPVHLIAFAFYFIIEIRIWFDTATIDTFISNPFIAAFYQSFEPIIKIVK